MAVFIGIVGGGTDGEVRTLLGEERRRAEGGDEQGGATN